MKGCGSRRDNYDRRMQQEIERLREERGGGRPRLADIAHLGNGPA